MIDPSYIRFRRDHQIGDTFIFVTKNPYKSNKKYDCILHQTLINIFSESCLDSVEIKGLVRSPYCPSPEHADQDSLIQMVLSRKPVFYRSFPSQLNYSKLSLLWIAILCTYDVSVELLVRTGADVNEIFGYPQPYMIAENSSVLHVLLLMYPSSRNERLIRLVVDHGADLNARDVNGQTPLHYAAKQGRVGVAEMFLEKGADANVADKQGMTPLLTAARTSVAGEMLSLLIKYGADFTAKDSDNMNVLHRLASVTKKGLVDLARFFIQQGVSLEDKESMCQYQPIHLAARDGNTELLELFLEQGADPNARCNQSIYPLNLATRNYTCTPSVLETLLRYGADVNLKTAKGRTALHDACLMAKYNANWNIAYHHQVGIILSAGPDLLVEDKDGNTAFALMENETMAIRCDLSSQLMLKALAIKKAHRQPMIELKDEKIIANYPMVWKYYQDCVELVCAMKYTRITKTCTFLELLTKSRSQIAELMRNREFEARFWMHDLNDKFSMYANDLLGAFEFAQEHYHYLLAQETVINEAVNNILPHMIVRKVARYIIND